MPEQKILIIEDEHFIVSLLADHLKKEGFNFDIAGDAEIGLTKAKEQIPDLILLDLILPGIGGFEFLEKIKADEELKDIPVLILSNLGQKDEVDQGLKLGAVDFMVKAHFDLDEITEKVKSILSRPQKKVETPQESLAEDMSLEL